MPSNTQTILCRYYYDALDSLIGLNRSGQDELQRFYCKSRLATEIQGQTQTTIMQQDDQILAQQQRMGGSVETYLLATDKQRSVLHSVGQRPRPGIVYCPYGYHPAESGLTSLLEFNGERRDVVTGNYVLGNGYRAFNPVLMRFNNPDYLSPFDEGGINAYSYCSGDPVNRSDPSGKNWFSLTTKKLHGLWLSYTNKSFPIDLAELMKSAAEKSKGLPKKLKKTDEAWKYPELPKEMSERAAGSAYKRMFSEIEVGDLVEPGLAYIKDHSKKHIVVMYDLRRVARKEDFDLRYGHVLSPRMASRYSENLSFRLQYKKRFKPEGEFSVDAKKVRLGPDNGQ